MKTGDKLLIAAVIIFSVCGFIYLALNPAAPGTTVYIEKNGKLYETLSLNQDKKVMVHVSEDDYNIVEVKNGKARISKTNCPDKVCIKQGWINKTGESIVCLPHKVVVRIPGEMQDVDEVTY